MEIKKCRKETLPVIGKEGPTNISMKEADNPQKVAEIVQATIKEIYPHYYPVGVVKFFMDLHKCFFSGRGYVFEKRISVSGL